jgi:5-methylcytosine-specific restriction endonuclease McrA
MEKVYLLEKDGRRSVGVITNCLQCGNEFIARKRFYKNGGGKYCSVECRGKSDQNRTLLKCNFCGTEFYRVVTKIAKSRSGLHFCSRVCKDKAQRLKSGKEFDAIRPDHFGDSNGRRYYRDIAFEYYPIKCANIKCLYDEDDRLLEVHHRDMDRDNNLVENLVILCSRCHRGVTSGYYELNENSELIEIKADGHWAIKE